jgi:hypothetical protein
LKIKRSLDSTEADPEAPGDSPLLNRFNLLNDFVEVRPVTGLKLGMEQLSVGMNLERAATGRN